MKCLTCGNEIPDNSTICSFCNHPVDNNINLSDTAIIPATPTSPILPQDQDMLNYQTENVVLEENMATPLPQNNNEVVKATSMPGPAVNPEVKNINTLEPIANSEVPNIPTSPQPTSNQPISQIISEPTNDIVPPQKTTEPITNSNTNVSIPENNIVTINPDGTESSSGNGIKLASSYQEEKKVEKKKKQVNKKKLLIILVIFIILGLLGGGAYYFYTKQFKTASIRTNLVVDKLTSVLSFNNDSVNISSGKFASVLSYAADKTNYKVDISGEYAYDLKKQLSNNKITINTLNNGEELISKPIDIELYINDNKEYLLLNDIYENYITREDESLEEIFKGIKKNDINYNLIITGYKNALKSALGVAPKSQSIKDYNGKKVNVVTLTIRSDIKKILLKQFYTSLANNQMFLEEYAKLLDYSKDDVSKQFNEMANNAEKVEYGKETLTFNLYTDIFKDEFIALISTITKDKEIMNLSIKPKGNGYDINLKKDKQDILNASYSKTIKRDSKVVEESYEANLTLFKSDVAHKFDLNLTNTKDINPKVEKKAIKNSINYQHVSPEILDSIKTNLKNNGKIGLTFNEYFDNLKSILNPDGTYSIIYDLIGEYETADPIIPEGEGFVPTPEETENIIATP